MLGETSYTPPKNKYPQYTRKSFEQLNYARTWANSRDLLYQVDRARYYEVLHKLSENPLNFLKD